MYPPRRPINPGSLTVAEQLASGRQFVARDKQCRYCKKMGLHWRNTLEGWRLAESSGFIHECKQYWDIELLHKSWLIKLKLYFAYLRYLNREHWGIGW